MKFIYNLLLLWGLVCFGQSSSQNYTATIQPKISKTISEYELISGIPSSGSYLMGVTYKDGLGRDIQIVDRAAGLGSMDVVTFMEYDQFGRMPKKYFPFSTPLPSTNLIVLNNGNYVASAKTQQASYYMSNFLDSTPFAETAYDNSPLNTVVESSKGGDVWKIVANSDADKTTKLAYGVNNSGEIRKNVLNANSIIDNSTYYDYAKLIKLTKKGENWLSTSGNLYTTQVYSDQAGRKIAENTYYQEAGATKKLTTEYVYDTQGQLRYVLPPKVSGYDFSTYNSSTGGRNFSFSKFTYATSGSGGMTATINSGVLTITFSAGFSTANLRTGALVYLDDRIPDTNLGAFGCNTCGTNYTASIQNGYFCLSAVNPTLVTSGFNVTYTVNVGNIAFISNQQMLDKYAFQYTYDSYNRKVAQKTPGRGWEYTVYDKLDRAILTQDANLKEQNKWLFTKYDVYGRVAYTGLYVSQLSRDDLQAQADDYIENSGNLSNYESFSSTYTLGFVGGVYFYYTMNAFPQSGVDIHTVNYYDTYTLNGTTFPFPNPVNVQDQPVTANVKGLQTISFIKNITESGKWTITWTYYDNEARPIYTYQKNYLGGYTINETKYNFTGSVEKEVTKHKQLTSSVETVITDRYTFDVVNRPIGHYQIVNNQAEEAIVLYTYDGTGQLIKKDVGGLTTQIPLQKITFKNNIRGWLTDVNDVNNVVGNLFSYHLNYNTTNGTGTAVYDGNVSQSLWRSNVNNVITGLNSYNYSYDYLMRMSSASFTGTNPLNGNSANGYFNESLTYDEHGNIKTVNRTGLNVSTGGGQSIDNLTYTYDGNQLLKIDDSLGTLGFNNGTTAGSSLNDYEYDGNGNLIKDRNKGIDNITYNYHDLAELVTFSSGATIKFTYDANGNKLAKVYTPASGTAVTTYYLGGFQYQGNTLQYFPTEEGYVSRGLSGSNEVFTYIYNYTDHLGNIRLSYKGTNNLIVEEHFDTGYGGFTPVGGTTLSNTSAKLSVAIPVGVGGSIGAQRLILSNVTAGTRVSISATAAVGKKSLLGGTAEIILVKYDVSGNITEESLGEVSGSFTFDTYFTTAVSSVYLKVVTAVSSSATTLTVDDLYVYTTTLQTLSASNYYPYGMIHGGEYLVGEASLYNYRFQGKEFQTEPGLNFYDFGSRLYDPSVGRWFSPDPQNQYHSPYLALADNPVRIIDPNGEWGGWDDLGAMLIGGSVNLVSNLVSGNVGSFWEGVEYFGVGAAAGEATLYGGPAAGGAVMAMGNNAVHQLNHPGPDGFDGLSLVKDGLIGFASGYIGGVASSNISGPIGMLFSKIPNQFAQSYLTNLTTNFTVGVLMGYGSHAAFGTEFDLKSIAVSSFATTSTSFMLENVLVPTKGYYENKARQKAEAAARKAEADAYRAQQNSNPFETHAEIKIEISPAEAAAEWQGSGNYPGVDSWRNIILKQETIVVGGLPGPSEFYTTQRALNRSNLETGKLWEGLQVMKNPKYGYRPTVGIYRVTTTTTPAAMALTLANTQFGAGGLPQIYIPSYSVHLELIKIVPLK